MTDFGMLLKFVRTFLGSPNVGTDPANRGQCVGLVERWLATAGRQHVPGNAVDLLANARTAALEAMYNTPTNYPQPGDIVCWDATWGKGYGHCAVVLAANVNFLVAFEENNPAGSAPTVATHSYAGVVGWIWW